MKLTLSSLSLFFLIHLYLLQLFKAEHCLLLKQLPSNQWNFSSHICPIETLKQKLIASVAEEEATVPNNKRT